MRRIALRSLAHDRGKLAASIAGVAFAATLLLSQIGLYAGFLETSCAIQIRAQSGGGELIPVPKEVLDRALDDQARPARSRGSRGNLVWPGLVRRLDRQDPSYKD